MAKYTNLTVAVTGHTDKAVRCTFYEDEPEETEDVWVPLKCLEDPMVVDPKLGDIDDDGNVEISVAKWFLKENDIPYESDSRDPEEPKEPVRRSTSRRE